MRVTWGVCCTFRSCVNTQTFRFWSTDDRERQQRNSAAVLDVENLNFPPEVTGRKDRARTALEEKRASHHIEVDSLVHHTHILSSDAQTRSGKQGDADRRVWGDWTELNEGIFVDVGGCVCTQAGQWTQRVVWVRPGCQRGPSSWNFPPTSRAGCWSLCFSCLTLPPSSPLNSTLLVQRSQLG